MSLCRLVQRHVGAWVDGELDPATLIEFERHADACAPCQERVEFERQCRVMVREAVGDVRAPESLRQRLRIAIDEPPRALPQPLIRFIPLGWRHVGVVAAVAGVFVVVGGAMNVQPTTRSAGLVPLAARPVLEDVVRLHSSSLPADVPAAGPLDVSHFFRGKVAFPVRPAVFERRDVRFVGARLSNVREQRAAALFYDVSGARMTVVVFGGPPLDASGVQRMRLRGRDVLYGDVHGHAVPLRRQGTLHYAFTGDLDRSSLIDLAASAQVR